MKALMTHSGLLSTNEVAHRLGVKRETVYAYVSRGLLERHPSSGHRHSQFDADSVDRLAGRARRRDRSGALEVIIETRLTLLDPQGRLFYRGRDAVELARFRSFEQTAGLLWDGAPAAPWELDATSAATVADLRQVVPETTPATERIPLIVAGLAATDPRRSDRRPEAVRRTAVRLLAGILDGLPAATAPSNRTAAARLWAALSVGGQSPRPAQLAALDAALVLLADHELAPSTLAARVAASSWADPYRVVLAGLGALGGTLHGAASLAIEGMLAGMASPEAAFEALQSRLAVSGVPPGFGHRVYRNRDPRADHLLTRLGAAAATERSARMVTALVEAAAIQGLPAPNVDLALAGLCYAMRLRPGSAGAIFTVSRLVGLLAHAIEEYPHRLRFRPRASYVGAVPHA